MAVAVERGNKQTTTSGRQLLFINFSLWASTFLRPLFLCWILFSVGPFFLCPVLHAAAQREIVQEIYLENFSSNLEKLRDKNMMVIIRQLNWRFVFIYVFLYVLTETGTRDYAVSCTIAFS